MNAQVTNLPAETPRRSVLVTMATKYNMEPAAFEQTLRATVVPEKTTREQFAAFLVVANEYGLNPLTKEIYAFPARTGGIQPIVSVDGWLNIINSHPQCNGIEFDDHMDKDGKVSAITARIWRKDRDKPTVVTEYLAECNRDTDTWKKYPRRMLRHKALIQCARYAFGFAGIVDPDEAERIGVETPMRDVTPRDDGPPAPPSAKQSDPVAMVEDGRDNGEQVEWADAPSTDNLEIPASLDRRPNGNGISAADRDWLKELAGAFSSCENLEQFAEQQKKVMAPDKGKVSSTAWGQAQKLAEDTYQRVRDN